MKRLAYAALAALLLVSSIASFPADPSNRPPGVTAEEWVPVSDRLGIVLAPPVGPMAVIPRDPAGQARAGQPLLLKPPVGGYFMVKGAGGWSRLVVIEPVKGPADAG